MTEGEMERYKKLYKDAIERVFYQFNRSLVNECFMDKRISDKMSESAPSSKIQVDLDDLYRNVIEDDKTQPDPSMSLWLDATLIRKFYYKLEPQMKTNLMQLFKQRLNADLKLNERNFDEHNLWNR